MVADVYAYPRTLKWPTYRLVSYARRFGGALSSGTEEIAREQQYVTGLYTRLDDLRDSTERRFRDVLRNAGGTPQQRTERDGAAAGHARRLAQLNAAENGLCFGRLDLIDGGRQYIGRIGLLNEDDDYEPLLIDWRAPAARAFYVATAAAPFGVRRRRHIRTRMRAVVGLDDDALDLDLDRPGAGAGGLVGEAALLAAVNANRTGRMRDVVETIQREQDDAIRANAAGVLVVQGGPGTGKTAVALHRAAYLLYTHRERLARRGVLIIGPNPTFLHYISHVLPGLGETGAVLRTLGELFPGVVARRGEPPEVAQTKGRAEMKDVVAAAVRARQRLPEEALEITVDHVVYRLDRETCLAAAERARRTHEPHNLARPVFVEHVLDALTEQAARLLNEDPFEELTRGLVKEIARDLSALDDAGFDGAGHDDAGFGDAVPGDGVFEDTGLDGSGSAGSGPGSDRPRYGAAPGDVPLLDAAQTADLRRELAQEPAVLEALDWLWPRLTPQRLLSDLFASADRLAEAAPELTEAQRALLLREPGGGWSPADVPLLDEAAELLGAVDTAARLAEARRDEAVQYAQGVLDIISGSLAAEFEDPSEEQVKVTDYIDAETLADSQEQADERTVAERAAADRTWTFGHLIVDEAQELSAMAWRLLMRRCPSRSMTIVGDVAQTGDLAGTSSWAAALAPHVGDRWRLAELTVNYRTPAEVMNLAARVLHRIDPALEPPRSVRASGSDPVRETVPADRLAARLGRIAAREAASVGDGRLAVIVPAEAADELARAVADAVPDTGHGADPDLESRTVVLTVRQAKGLEFDTVIVADPDAIAADPARGDSDLYVALTRVTQRLCVLEVEPSGEGTSGKARALDL